MMFDFLFKAIGIIPCFWFSCSTDEDELTAMFEEMK